MLMTAATGTHKHTHTHIERERVWDWCSSSVTAQCNKEKVGSCSLTQLTPLNIHNTKSLLIKTHNRGLLQNSIAANISLKGMCMCVCVCGGGCERV